MIFCTGCGATRVLALVKITGDLPAVSVTGKKGSVVKLPLQ